LAQANGKTADYMASMEREAKKIVNVDFFNVQENPKYE
jgi:hypothetical protein